MSSLLMRLSLCAALVVLLSASQGGARAAPSTISLTEQGPAAFRLSTWISSQLSRWKPERKRQSFTLRKSIHKGVYDYPSLVAWKHHAEDRDAPTYTLKTVKQSIRRAKDPKAYLAARGQSLESAQCATREMLNWEDVEVDAPDTSDRQTLLALSKMAAQAYENSTDSWEPGYGGFNLSESFGWVEDGMRGHLFTTNDNSTVVVAVKGTSPPFVPGGGDTARRDKANDNMLFSCCCARVSWTWTPVCDCYQGKGSRCGQTCLERALVEKSFYYPAATDLYNNVSFLYPDSQIWITGHSLGGAVSSLIGMTFGIPTVTFEAPGERLAAKRLHLPMPPPTDPEDSPIAALPITHVYHNADPLAVGECVGPLSACAQLGYAMESRCHAGKSIVYDTVGRLGWSSSLLTHRIVTLTDDLLTEDWDKRVKDSRRLKSDEVHATRWRWPWQRGSDEEDDGDADLLPVPPRLSEDKCKDCSDWTFTDDADDD